MTTAAEVLDALRFRWPDSEYLSIPEAPSGPSRTGRKLDLLVVSLWASRGYELDGVEVKVSASDWKRELDKAEKADWWWHHVHRFWVAVPVALAPRVRDELPTGWGLLACSEGSSKVVVKPDKHTPERIDWPVAVSLMRASADAGVSALYRAEQRGYNRGVEVAKQQAERTSGDAMAKAEIERLRGVIRAFEEKSGLRLSSYDGPALAAKVALVTKAMHDPSWAASTVRGHGERLARSAREVTALADALAEVVSPAGVQS